MRTEYIVASVVGVAAVVVGAGVYVSKKKGWLTGRLRRMMVVGGGIAPPDLQKCTDEPTCTAVGYNTTTGESKIYTADPYTNWVEDVNWVLYVRRPSAQQPSSWSDWAPATCPTDCGDPISRKRVCQGSKCAGPSDKPCNRHPCPMWEQYAAGLYPDDRVSYTAIPGMNEADCKQTCLGDPYCNTWAVGQSLKSGGGQECRLWGVSPKGFRPAGLVAESADFKATACGSSVPVENNGKWGAFPDKSACVCGGPTVLQRPCTTGTDCKLGMSYLKCPSTVCGYDTFTGGHLP